MFFAKKKKEPEFDPTRYVIHWPPGINRRKSIAIARANIAREIAEIDRQIEIRKERLRKKGFHYFVVE